MRNSALITSDQQHIIVNDLAEGGKLAIGKRGVLLSVLGNDLVGSQVSADLDDTLSGMLKGKKPFFEFASEDLEKNHICLSYQEQSNTLYVIGISDLVIGFASPTDVPPNKVKAKAVKLKPSPQASILSNQVVVVRLEGSIGRPKMLAFYLVNVGGGI